MKTSEQWMIVGSFVRTIAAAPAQQFGDSVVHFAAPSLLYAVASVPAAVVAAHSPAEVAMAEERRRLQWAGHMARFAEPVGRGRNQVGPKSSEPGSAGLGAEQLCVAELMCACWHQGCPEANEVSCGHPSVSAVSRGCFNLVCTLTVVVLVLAGVRKVSCCAVSYLGSGAPRKLAGDDIEAGAASRMQNARAGLLLPA